MEGKCRPWLKRMIIPTFFAIFLLVCVPHGNQNIQVAYAVLTNIFTHAFVYTGIAIPFYTMINFMTKSLEERGKIGAMRDIFNNGIGIIIGTILLPITKSSLGNPINN